MEDTTFPLKITLPLLLNVIVLPEIAPPKAEEEDVDAVFPSNTTLPLSLSVMVLPSSP